MPFPVAAAIAAGAQVASTAGNAYLQGKTNLKTRQFAEEMYFRQRADALSDWEKTLPVNQMKYLREAGLNPNLVYGNGAEATVAPRAAPVQSWNPKAPELDLGSAAAAYNNTKMQMAQQDLMQKQKELLDTDIAQKNAQTRGIEIDNQQKEGLMPYTLQGAELNINRTKQDMDLAMQRNAREALSNNASLLNAAADLTNKNIDTLLKQQEQATNRMQQQKIQQEIEVQRQILKNLKSEGDLKKLDIKFKENLPPGTQPNDSYMMRKLQEIINIAKDPIPWLKDKFVPFPHR